MVCSSSTHDSTTIHYKYRKQPRLARSRKGMITEPHRNRNLLKHIRHHMSTKKTRHYLRSFVQKIIHEHAHDMPHNKRPCALITCSQHLQWQANPRIRQTNESRIKNMDPTTPQSHSVTGACQCRGTGYCKI